MLIKDANKIAGTLGKTSKMPCKSYGIPAVKTCPVGAKLRRCAGSVCSECYATKGQYPAPDVKKGQSRRLSGTKRDQWVDAMETLINKQCKTKLFRFHDAGDVYSDSYMEKLIELGNRTPNIKYWIPTKEIGRVKKYADRTPENMLFRVSGYYIGKKAEGGTEYTSTVGYAESTHNCPAPGQDDECRSCRMCWDKSVKNINYKLKK